MTGVKSYVIGRCVESIRFTSQKVYVHYSVPIALSSFQATSDVVRVDNKGKIVSSYQVIYLDGIRRRALTSTLCYTLVVYPKIRISHFCRSGQNTHYYTLAIQELFDYILMTLVLF